mgnify:CR=1 FL=1
MKKIPLIVALLFVVQLSNAQNTCLTATPITTGGSFVVGTINVTGGAPSPICAPNSTAATAGKWYAYTPSQNYTVTVTSDLNINAGGDTRFHVYTGVCGALTCISGDDDSGVVSQVSAGTGAGTSTYLSVATFNVMAGTTYYIAWDNRWTANGFTFNLSIKYSASFSNLSPRPCC